MVERGERGVWEDLVNDEMEISMAGWSKCGSRGAIIRQEILTRGKAHDGDRTVKS